MEILLLLFLFLLLLLLLLLFLLLREVVGQAVGPVGGDKGHEDGGDDGLAAGLNHEHPPLQASRHLFWGLFPTPPPAAERRFKWTFFYLSAFQSALMQKESELDICIRTGYLGYFLFLK